MSRGGYKGRENFAHKFEVCPNCGKKGVYERSMPYRRFTREKRCKYCQSTIESNKTHGLSETAEQKERKAIMTPAFTFHLPHGEPLCGQQWVDDHLYDLIDWVPRIEITSPNLHLTVEIDSKKKMGDVVKAMRGLKCQNSKNTTTTSG
jgi:hypothetical protein